MPEMEDRLFEVRDEEELPGLGDLIATQTVKALDEGTLARYGEILNASDLPLGRTMGVVRDLRTLVERTLFRKLVRELPEENCALPWFECHVPPRGSAQIRSSVTSGQTSGLELKVFGAGLGRGRKTSIAVSSASEPRKACATYALDFRVKPRVYKVRGAESVELEIVKCLGTSVVTNEPCPYCGLTASDVDSMSFRFGEHLDLRKDRVATKLKVQVVVENSASIDAGIKLVSVPVELKLSATVSHGYSLEIESEFPPGFLYSAYTRLATGPFQTSMWATDGAK